VSRSNSLRCQRGPLSRPKRAVEWLFSVKQITEAVRGSDVDRGLQGEQTLSVVLTYAANVLASFETEELLLDSLIVEIEENGTQFSDNRVRETSKVTATHSVAPHVRNRDNPL